MRNGNRRDPYGVADRPSLAATVEGAQVVAVVSRARGDPPKGV